MLSKRGSAFLVASALSITGASAGDALTKEEGATKESTRLDYRVGSSATVNTDMKTRDMDAGPEDIPRPAQGALLARDDDGSDRQLREKVLQALSEQTSLDGSRIQVQVESGRVRLEGTAGDRAQADRALEAARQAAGGAEVRSALQVEG